MLSELAGGAVILGIQTTTQRKSLILNNTRCTGQLSDSVFTCMLQQMPHNNNLFFFSSLGFVL